MIKFKVDKSYSIRSICDSECIWNIKIVKRTAKTVTLEINNEIKTCRIYHYEGVEHARPLGTYSMCPTLRADREIKGAENE